MKKLKFRAIGLVCATLFAGSAMAQQVTLRLHQFLPPQATIPAKAIIPWAQKVEKESGGKIKVQMFHAMQMGGSPAQLFDQAKDGVADITWTVLGYTPGRFVKTEVFEIPFIAPSGPNAGEITSKGIVTVTIEAGKVDRCRHPSPFTTAIVFQTPSSVARCAGISDFS